MFLFNLVSLALMLDIFFSQVSILFIIINQRFMWTFFEAEYKSTWDDNIAWSSNVVTVDNFVVGRPYLEEPQI